MLQAHPLSIVKLLGLAILVLSIAPVPCRASARYTFTDLGPSDGGLPVFDALGMPSPTSISTVGQVRSDAGPNSISYNLTDGSLAHALAVTVGLPSVQINPSINGDGFQGPVPYAIAQYPGTWASAVNASGTFVGTQYGDEIGDKLLGLAFSFTRAGGTMLVPTPYSGFSNAYSINDAGLIVGQSTTPTSFRAFLSDGHTSWDLNTLIGPQSQFLLTSATDINSRGQILGIATDGQYREHMYLLTPLATPEPSSFALLCVGCVAIVVARRRVRRGAA